MIVKLLSGKVILIHISTLFSGTYTSARGIIFPPNFSQFWGWNPSGIMRSAKNMNAFNSFNVLKESEARCVNGINHINQEIMGTVPGNSDTAMRNDDEVSSNCTDKFFLCW